MHRKRGFLNMNTTSLTKMQRELVAVTEERDRLAAELAKLRAAPALPAPTPFTPDDDTRRNDEVFAAIKPGSAAGIMSPMNACMHRDTCRAMLQSAPMAAPAAPAVVFLAHNNNSKLLFAVREEAERFAASCGPAAGVAVTEYAVIGSKSAPQATAISVRLINALKEMKAGAYKQLDHGKGRAIFIDSNIAIDIADALLQSAVVKDSLTAQADCRACVNLGRVNGLSQESYCESCVYEGRNWRKNHFLDAAGQRLLEGGE